MEIAIGIVVIVIVVGLVYLLVQKLRPEERPSPLAHEEQEIGKGPVITLDIEAADPEDPVVQRLMNDAAAQYFSANPDAEEVEVRDRAGKVLGRPTRKAAEEGKELSVPDHLYEPHARRHAPGPGEHVEGGGAAAKFEAGADAPDRTLAELFDLPPAVRSKLQHPNDPVDICRAILEAAGLPAEVSGDLVKSGDDALVIVDTAYGAPVRPDDLSQAFLRFQESKARRGVVVSPGLMYPHEVKKRQAMAPNLKHAGPEGIQRMADAVSLGANPLKFITGPPVG